MDARGAAERDQMNRKHIFAVNGEPSFLELIRVLLQDEKYNVTITNFVPRTFDVIVALQASLLIVDLVIHETAGWALLERLQREALTHGIPVIVTSTLPELLERARENEERFGHSEYLVKPFDLEILLQSIDHLIGSA